MIGAGALSIGIDVGGTKIAAGLLDPDSGERLGERTVPTRPDRGGLSVLRECAGMAAGLAASAPGRVGSVGIGLPELVDSSGRPASGETIDWRHLDLVAQFGTLPRPALEADVRAAARAEARFGAGAGCRHWIYISIGTGISSTIVTDGVPMTGARGAALVLASGPVSVPCPDDRRIVRFTLEEFASGAAIARRWQAAGGGPTATAETAIATAEAGDPAASDILATAATALGSAIGWLVNVADPEAVVLGGGLGIAGGLWRDALSSAIRAHIWNPAARDLPIIPAALGPAAGWIGAALVASERRAVPAGKEAPSSTLPR